MQLEFHQLDRRGEHLRVQQGARQKRLLASLAMSGQQTPIVVVAVPEQADRYLVIDGYKRVTALEQLGRDTVEAVVLAMSEAEALVLDRSLRWSERESALEEGWLLAELEQRFGYHLEELARRSSPDARNSQTRTKRSQMPRECSKRARATGKLPAPSESASAQSAVGSPSVQKVFNNF